MPRNCGSGYQVLSMYPSAAALLTTPSPPTCPSFMSLLLSALPLASQPHTLLQPPCSHTPTPAHTQAPPRQWLLSFMAHLDASLTAASCQALTNTLWAAGRLQLTTLPGSWLDSLLGRLFWQLPRASSQEMGVVLGALQALHHRPNSKWMARCV